MNCEIQEKCGGCVYGKIQYAQQLKTKTEYVEKQLKKLKQNIKVNVKVKNLAERYIKIKSYKSYK